MTRAAPFLPPPRAICFDLFHTLVDVAGVPDHVGRDTADVLGVSREHWHRACFGAGHEIRRPTDHYEVLRALAHSIDPEIPLDRIEQAAAERQARFDHALCQVPPSTLSALSGLRRLGLPLALVSNASTGEVRAWARSPLAAHFDVALFSCECGHAKPEPGIYRLAAQRLGVAPRDCWFVGDGGSDEHAGAASVDMLPIMLTGFVASRLDAGEYARRRAGVRYEVAHPGAVLDLARHLLEGRN